MAETFGVGFVIGASLASTVTSSFTTINNKVKETSSNFDDLSKRSKDLQKAFNLQTTVNDLQGQVMTSGGQDKDLQKSLEKNIVAYEKAKTVAESYGVSVDNLGRESARASRSLAEYNAKLENQRALAAQSEVRSQLKPKMLSTMALGYAITAPIRSAMEFESAMSDVKKVTDFTVEGFKEFSTQVMSLSTKIPLTTTELSEIIAVAGQAGIAQEDLLSFTTDAATMSVAFGMTAKEVGSVMLGLCTQFKLSQVEVVSLGDAINHLSNNTGTIASDLVSFTNRVAGSASVYGFSAEKISALGAAFKAMQVGTEEAATATNFMLTRLGTADTLGQDAEAAFNSIGLSGHEMATMFKDDAQGALLAFLEAAKKSDDPMRVINTIFGSNHAPKIIKLVDGLGKYKEALNLISDKQGYAGSMQEEYEKKVGTLKTAMILLKNAISSVSVSIGDVFIPKITAVVQAITPFVEQISGFIAVHPELVTAIGGAVAGFVAIKGAIIVASYVYSLYKSAILSVGGVKKWLTSLEVADKLATVKNIALKIKDIAVHGARRTAIIATAMVHKTATFAMIVGTKALTTAQNLLNLAFSNSPWGWVVKAVGAVAMGMVFLYNTCEPVRAVFDSVFSWIGSKLEWVTACFQKIKNTFSAVAGVFGFGEDEEQEISINTSTEINSNNTEESKILASASQPIFTQMPPAFIPYIPPMPDLGSVYNSSGSNSLGNNAFDSNNQNSFAVTQNFSIQGVSDTDFAKNVINAINSQKPSFEKLINEIVNNQRRLSYGS